MLFSLGIKLVAAASLVSAAVLIGGCSWTFYNSSLDLNDRLNNSGVAQSKSKFRKYPNRNIETNGQEDYDSVLHEMEILWLHNEPLFLILSAIGTVVGIFQLLSSFILLLSTAKKTRKFTRHWLIIQIIMFFLLVLVLLCTMVGRTEDGNGKKTWTHLLYIFNAHLKEKQPDQDFTNLMFQLQIGFTILHGSVGQDVVGILLFFFLTVHLNKEFDYEPQP